MSEPSLIDIASRLAIFAANEADEEGDLNHVPKSIIVDSKAELDHLRAERELALAIIRRVAASPLLNRTMTQKLAQDYLAKHELPKETEG